MSGTVFGIVSRSAGLLRGAVPGKRCNPHRACRSRSTQILAENMLSERSEFGFFPNYAKREPLMFNI
jgi:hypothetical protein